MKNLKIIGLLAAAVIAAGALYWSYRDGQIHPSTDDAYLQANILTIASQISGRVEAVSITENAYVTKDDVLFTIDAAQFKAALETAQANFDQATQGAGAAESNVTVAEASVSSAQSALAVAQSDFMRQKSLFDKGDVAQAALDIATNALDQARAQLASDNAALEAAKDQAGQPGRRNALVRAATGALQQAQFNLDYATVTAPADGWIANISLRPGQVVTAGQPLFSLVEDGHWWVDGNFKETDLTRIRAGQPAEISIDMYPGTTIKGRVESIGAGSGAVFSLLPAENATGNWVKVTQRFPVRISIEATPSDAAKQLRVGASVTAIIDTKALDAK